MNAKYQVLEGTLTMTEAARIAHEEELVAVNLKHQDLEGTLATIAAQRKQEMECMAMLEHAKREAVEAATRAAKSAEDAARLKQSAEKKHAMKEAAERAMLKRQTKPKVALERVMQPDQQEAASSGKKVKAAVREALEMRATLSTMRTSTQAVRARMTCSYCEQEGHLLRCCPVLDAEVDADINKVFDAG